MEEKTMQEWKKVALGVFIMVAFVAFVMLAMNTLYRGPQGEDYFGKPIPMQEFDTQEECEAHGGKWNVREEGPKRVPAVPVEREGEVVPVVGSTGWCDLQFYASQEYEKARESHDRNAAIILGVISIAAFVVGVFRVLPAPVGGGLAFGGIVLSLISLGQYWDYTNEYVRLGIIGIILVFLIGLAYRYAKGDDQKKKVEEKSGEAQEA